MLYEGLVPCYREESSREWKRVIHRVDTAAIVNEIQYSNLMKDGLNGPLNIL
jgi:hypothetical protein